MKHTACFQRLVKINSFYVQVFQNGCVQRVQTI